jgi:hypothetical protein
MMLVEIYAETVLPCQTPGVSISERLLQSLLDNLPEQQAAIRGSPLRNR